jgi:LEA14-like dessication related protein
MIGSSRILALLGALLAALALTSCSQIEEPVVTMTGVDFNGISTEGLSFDLLVDVQNPNGFGADISGLEYEVRIDGIEVAAGKQLEAVTVPAGATVEVGVPFTIVWSGMDKGLKKLLDGKRHEWNLNGSVRLNKGALSRTFPFSEKGEFDAPNADDIEIDINL